MQIISINDNFLIHIDNMDFRNDKLLPFINLIYVSKSRNL